jgi:hypothetical protein
VVHEGGDQEEPDRQTEDQHHPSTPPVGPDDELTEGYESASSLSDVTPSAYNHTIENGRRYQHFKNGRYPIPNDDEEHERENLKHSMVLEVCGWRLYHAPIRNPHIILDIGTGSGQSTESTHLPEMVTNVVWQVSGQSTWDTNSLTHASVASTCLLTCPVWYRRTSSSL